MARTFGLVDAKVAEADFFLEQLNQREYELFVFRCYVSAFAASARSITYALQASLKHVEGFAEWYENHRQRLRNDPLAKFFHDFRRISQHVGDDLYGRGQMRSGVVLHYFSPSKDLPKVPNTDIATSCKLYFKTLLEIVYSCYLEFGPIIDARQYFTQEHFDSIDKTIEDAEEELGFRRGHTDIGASYILADRWKVLRSGVVGCEINDIFEIQLGKTVG